MDKLLIARIKDEILKVLLRAEIDGVTCGDIFYEISRNTDFSTYKISQSFIAELIDDIIDNNSELLYLHKDGLEITQDYFNEPYGIVDQMVIDYEDLYYPSHKTEYYIECGGFTRIEKENLKKIKHQKNKEELEFKKLQNESQLVRKINKDYLSTKVTGWVAIIITVAHLIYDIIKEYYK